LAGPILSVVRRARERADLERLAAEIDDAGPYLELAREIQAEVARIAADPSAHIDLLVELLDSVPRDERMKLAQRIFSELAPERQWDVLEQAYGDGEIKEYLQAQRSVQVAEARARTERLRLVAAARAGNGLGTGDIPAGELLTLGLFREHDVRAALSRGEESSTCARRLVLRSTGDGRFQVIEDVFNPAGGYFVTAEYSEETWRTRDRLSAHTIVRVGSVIEADGASGPRFDPVLYPGGRTDFEVAGRRATGQLHLGFASLSGVGIFAD
jgi:hypothetical protein